MMEIKMKNEINTNQINKSSFKVMLADIKSLTKGIVLYANVLPSLAGFWLALYFTGQSFAGNWDTFLLMIVGSTFVIAGALMFNNWYEVDLDREMDRTQKRPTVTGNFSLKTVLTLAISTTIIGLIIMLFTTIEATIYAFLGWFTYVVLYTFWSKRKYTLNTVVGSISGAFTPLIGWAAIDSAFHIIPVALFLILFIWQIPHTFSIAMRRVEEYRAAGVPMLPVAYGFEITKRQTVIYIISLMPIPFFMIALGPTFVIVATLLNLGWMVIGLRGFFMKDDIRWANLIFFYSLTYLFILFGLMMVVTLPVFHP
ncbi:MAG TPA: heme o synthase [Bacillota bacterium]|nr:heme o synthase [Bacillota bacterium]